MPRPRMYLSRPSSGPPKVARLSFCELVYLFTIINAAALHLLIERNAMEPHVGADRLRHGAVMSMRLGYDAFAISEAMTHSVGYGAVPSEVSDYGAVLAPTASSPGDLALLLHGERL